MSHEPAAAPGARFADLASASRRVAGTPARGEKVALLAACLRGVRAGEVQAAVAYLSGELLQRRTGVGPAALRALPGPAAVSSLTVAEVDRAFDRIAGCAGPGAHRERQRLLTELFAAATEPEQRFLAGLVAGELRQGALEGVMVDAVARAAGVPASELRPAVMLRGALGPVAEAVLTEGRPALTRFRLQVGRPLQPMLAAPADGIREALGRISPAGVEWKVDGVRVQLHRDGTDVAVFTRTLEDITARVPELRELALSLPVRTAVLDGEAVALDRQGRPRRFQETASRIGSHLDVARGRAATPLTPCLFDLLHLDGADLLGEPAAARQARLGAVVPAELVVPRLVTDAEPAASAFFADALARGHEGVLVKSLDAPYAAGRRGAGWLKVKPRHTLDLVVLAAEWGHGRRRDWLSNLHLGARDPGSDGFVMLGKTFKGLTDEMLRWQTERLLALATSPREDWVVHVRPLLVVEVAFDGVQTSPRYPGGVALRFARVLRHRPDKPAEEADTIDAVLAIHSSG